MPCRKKCCGHHTTPCDTSAHTGRPSIDSQYIPHAAIVSSSRSCLPNVHGPSDRQPAPCSESRPPCCRSGTPCSIRSRTSCIQEYCTSETCRNSGNCCEHIPHYCPYGRREENEEVGSCSRLCRGIAERTADTQLQTSNLGLRSSNIRGVYSTVSTNTSAVNLAPAPCAQRHQMPSCCMSQNEQQPTQNATSKPITGQQYDAIDQSSHRVSQNATQCPKSCNKTGEPTILPENNFGCVQYKSANSNYNNRSNQEFHPDPNIAPQNEIQCPMSCNTTEDTHLSVEDTECGLPECTNKPILKQQDNSNVQTSYRAPQSALQCPISCNTSNGPSRNSTANYTQRDESQCNNKQYQEQKDNVMNTCKEPQNETQCPTSCKTTNKPTLASNNVGCGQRGCTKTVCGADEEMKRDESQLSLGVTPTSQTGMSQPSCKLSKLNNIPRSSTVCPGTKGKSKNSSLQMSANEKRESINHQNKGTAVPSATCTSNACPGKKSTKCLCRYPPAFSQYGCTGNITGDCDCGNNK